MYNPEAKALSILKRKQTKMLKVKQNQINQKINLVLQTCTILRPQFVCFRDKFENWSQNQKLTILAACIQN